MGEELAAGPEQRARSLQEFLRTRVFGRKTCWHLQVGSTNDLAARLAAEGAPEGTLVVADQQEMGRGRGGRQWYSPPGLGLYFSLVLRPREYARIVPLQTFLTAVALTEVIRARCRLAATIRWPNDVFIEGRKVAGILAEARMLGSGIRNLVVGVGWNLRHRAADFPDDLRGRATSLAAAGMEEVNSIPLLAYLLEVWENWYERFSKEGADSLLEAWRRYSPESTGHWVRVADGKRILTGKTRGVDSEGALLVEGDDGCVNRIRFGEVQSMLEVRS
ncbi:MAG: biotin--[acetyl-CoA-carboxylase] ligase [Acidobacteria bacterium]|nr:biotin--[acetyl-CoA-carboxylase] ligase [Acidobacteriota bacterium]